MLVQFPLTAKQARSMIQMQRVQPEIKKIQAEVQGRQGEAERGAAEVLPREQDQPARRLPADDHHDPNRDRRVPDVLPGRAAPPPADRPARRALPRDLRNREHRRRAAPSSATLIAHGHTPEAMHFLGMSLNLTAHGAQVGGVAAAIPYYILDRAWSRSPVGTRCARPRPANCRAATRRRTRRCRR